MLLTLFTLIGTTDGKGRERLPNTLPQSQFSLLKAGINTRHALDIRHVASVKALETTIQLDNSFDELLRALRTKLEEFSEKTIEATARQATAKWVDKTFLPKESQKTRAPPPDPMQVQRVNSKFNKLVMDFNLLVAKAKPLGSKVRQLHQVAPQSTINPKPATVKKIHKRQKRGLINLGGEWLKFVVGTATEQDVNLLKKNLMQSNSLVRSELTFFQEEMKQLANNSQKVLREMERVESHMTTIDAKFEALYQSNIIEELLHYYDRHLVHLQKYVQKIEDIKKNLKFHNIENALSQAAFNELIEKLQTKHLKFFCPYGQNDTLMCSSWLKVLMVDDHTYLIVLPLVNNDVYSLYETKPFPRVTNNTRVTMIKNLPSEILWDNSNKRLAKTDLKTCTTTIRKYRLCQSIYPDLDHNTCEKGLIVNLTSGNCVHAAQEMPEFFVDSYKTGFAILFRDITTVSMTCDIERSKTPKLEELSGLVILEPPCNLYTSKFNITTVQHSFSNITIRVPLEKLIEFTNRDAEQNSFPSAHIFTEGDLARIRERTNKLMHTLNTHQTPAFNWDDGNTQNIVIFGVTAGTLTLLLITGTAALTLIYFCKCRQTNKNIQIQLPTQTAAPSSDTHNEHLSLAPPPSLATNTVFKNSHSKHTSSAPSIEE